MRAFVHELLAIPSYTLFNKLQEDMFYGLGTEGAI